MSSSIIPTAIPIIAPGTLSHIHKKSFNGQFKFILVRRNVYIRILYSFKTDTPTGLYDELQRNRAYISHILVAIKLVN